MPARKITQDTELARLRAAVACIEDDGPRAPEASRTPGDARGPGGARARSDAPAGGRAEPGPQADAGESRDPEAVARAIVLRQLANAPKTRRQLETALARRGCDADVAAAVLDRLGEVGLVDDAAYAQMYAHAARSRRGLARRAIAHDLRGKGVADEVAADVLDGVSEAQEAEAARGLVRARLPRLRGMDRDVQVRRLAGLLARKGYPSGIATRVVLEEVDAVAEHRRD